MTTRRKALWLLGGCVLLGALAYHAAKEPMDFRVYWHGARGVFDGTRPVYGPESGLGWPMHYRYPPLFLLLFAPLTLLPMELAAGLWMVLKALVVVALFRAIAVRLGFEGRREEWLVPLLLAGPYIVGELHFGNVQFFIIALMAACVLWLRTRPRLAAFSLALATSIKVWPLVFLPFLAARRQWAVVAWTLLFALGLTLLPSVYFGIGGNAELLAEWYSQEYATPLEQGETLFPGQSLRGVLLRYLTEVDYSQAPDSDYRSINLVSLDPRWVRLVWLVLAAALYAGLMLLMRSDSTEDGWASWGLAFCAVALLHPLTHKYSLSMLLWPAVVAGAVLARNQVPPWVRGAVYAAAALALLQPLVPGSEAQRLLRVLGLDVLVVVLLSAALVWMCLARRDHAPQQDPG